MYDRMYLGRQLGLSAGRDGMLPEPSAFKIEKTLCKMLCFKLQGEGIRDLFILAGS